MWQVTSTQPSYVSARPTVPTPSHTVHPPPLRSSFPSQIHIHPSITLFPTYSSSLLMTNPYYFKEGLYKIWCGVNTLGDSGVNTLGDTSAFVNPTVQLLLSRRGKIRMDGVGIVFEFYIAPLYPSILYFFDNSTTFVVRLNYFVPYSVHICNTTHPHFFHVQLLCTTVMAYVIFIISLIVRSAALCMCAIRDIYMTLLQLKVEWHTIQFKVKKILCRIDYK